MSERNESDRLQSETWLQRMVTKTGNWFFHSHDRNYIGPWLSLLREKLLML